MNLTSLNRYPILDVSKYLENLETRTGRYEIHGKRVSTFVPCLIRLAEPKLDLVGL